MVLFRCDKCVVGDIKSNNEEDNTRYRDVVHRFDFDYCTENPTFSKEGHIKLIDYKILMDKKGKFERLNAIKAQIADQETTREQREALQIEATLELVDE